MMTDVRRITVAIRELDEGGIWRCTPVEPVPAVLLLCDVRNGRPPEQRAQLASALISICA
jgi:hypothetical protein